MANLLANLFNVSPRDARLGSGMAEKARQTIADREQYRQYVIDAQSAGQEPMDYESWAAQVSNG